jgi:hypothetical protein
MIFVVRASFSGAMEEGCVWFVPLLVVRWYDGRGMRLIGHVGSHILSLALNLWGTITTQP